LIAFKNHITRGLNSFSLKKYICFHKIQSYVLFDIYTTDYYNKNNNMYEV